MDAPELDQGLQVLESCLAVINWRLKPSSKRRLQLDIMALCTRLRPVVMVDYGGVMPLLQHHLSSLLHLSQKESPVFEHLRVMVIQDMIYLIHLTELAHHVRSSLGSEQHLLFVDLQHEPPKMVTQIEESQVALQLVSIQKLFLRLFSPPEGTSSNDNPSSSQGGQCVDNVNSSNQCFQSLSDECIDLSNCMDNTDVTVPTLNGWLLGYPVVYLFGKDHIADAIYNLSTKYLHIFQVLVCRLSSSKFELLQEYYSQERSSSRRTVKINDTLSMFESFTVPYDLSMRGSNEQWAEAFLANMRAKWERCANAWKSLKMQVSECHPQAIVL